jgi:uncharacterized membrane protein HdeD (DUF308 family)
MDTNTKSVARAKWWLVLLRGIFMVLFGIIVLVRPGIALPTMVWLSVSTPSSTASLRS